MLVKRAPPMIAVIHAWLHWPQLRPFVPSVICMAYICGLRGKYYLADINIV